MRGIRGAITVEKNDSVEICNAVQEMLKAIISENELAAKDIGAAIFSATNDIDAVFPAAAARKMKGWDLVPLFDAQQMTVDGSIEKCIRVLLLVDTDKPQDEIRHIYLRRAKMLRPDILNK
ncbi:chorismate mutase [Pectinatus haikarae]|uniref:chorismate mutase n=1 Tax=Pectinatus haikarae TaxID=349096 RepID=A0ABT9Y818_9FIRM|nr:chorismate mutase [Pectinatus haikarae]MDQ0203978.1 chorismate mutase [Pectinatus haikarae]